jgi:hypothetical protein
VVVNVAICLLDFSSRHEVRSKTMTQPTVKHIIRLALGLAMTLVLSGAGECGGDGPVIKDPGFDVWCGDSLCSWKVDRGDIEKVGTWHGGDAGVSLLGSDTMISQLLRSSSTCLVFDFIANIDTTVAVHLEADVFSDGIADYSVLVPTARWQSLTYTMKYPEAALVRNVQLRFTKQGNGTAVLAQLEARRGNFEECKDVPATPLPPASIGHECLKNAECRSNLCVEGVCGECEPNAGTPTVCPEQQLCTPTDPILPTDYASYTCEPAASRELGESCHRDNNCVTGKCSSNVCSMCRVDADCSDNELCLQQRDPSNPTSPHTPWTCGQGQRETGDVCFNHSDCMSGSCNGSVRSQCSDGRQCNTTSDCPLPLFGSTEPGSCVVVGVQGGICN